MFSSTFLVAALPRWGLERFSFGLRTHEPGHPPPTPPSQGEEYEHLPSRSNLSPFEKGGLGGVNFVRPVRNS